MSNSNEETGIAYGVITANEVPELWAEIEAGGQSLTKELIRQAAVAEVHERINRLMKRNKSGLPRARHQVKAFVRRCIGLFLDIFSNELDCPTTNIETLPFEEMLATIKIAKGFSTAMAESMVQRVEELPSWNPDDPIETRYDYKDQIPEGFLHYQLIDSKSGTSQILVMRSPYIIRCRPCSPVYSGAGDLDNPHGLGMLTYCLPPDQYPEGFDLRPRLVEDFDDEPEKQEEAGTDGTGSNHSRQGYDEPSHIATNAIGS